MTKTTSAGADDANRLHSHCRPSPTIPINPICTLEWDVFYQEPIRYVQDRYPELLMTILPLHNNDCLTDSDNTPCISDDNDQPLCCLSTLIMEENDPANTKQSMEQGTVPHITEHPSTTLYRETSLKNNTPTTANTSDNDEAKLLLYRLSPLPKISIQPLCIPAWDEFYHEHGSFIQAFYLEPLPSNSWNNDDHLQYNDDDPICNDRSPANLVDNDHTTTNTLTMSISAANHSAIDPTFAKQWDAFYIDFLQYVQSIGVSTPSTTEDTIAPMPAASDAAPSTFLQMTTPKLLLPFHMVG